MILRWTLPAAGDLAHISDYTETRFGAAQARRTAMAIYEAVSSLLEMPERSRKGAGVGRGNSVSWDFRLS